MFWIVNSGEHVGIYVVDCLFLQQCLRETFRNFVTMANFVFPMLKGRGGFGWGVRSAPQRRGELRVHAAGEAKDHFSEVFLGGRVAAAPDHLLCVDVHKRLKRKVSLPDENGAGFRVVDKRKER